MTSESVNRLRRAAAAIRAGKPVPPQDAHALATAIEQALAGTPADEVAAGLAVPSPLSRPALARRAKLIHQLSFNYDGSLSGRAKQIAADAEDYAAMIWPELRLITTLPDNHVGKPEAILFALHREVEMGGARWPLGWRSLVDVLESLQPIRWDCKRIASQNCGP